MAALPLLSEAVEVNVDLETTGRDVLKDRPWQIAAMPRTWIVNPGREIDPGARKVCGIDDALLTRIQASPTWAETAPEVLAELRQADLIVAYNGLSFDGPLLRASLAAVGLDPSGLPPIIDPKVWAFELWPDLAVRIGDETRRDHKLKTVYLHVGGSMEGIRPHDAGGDCLMMRGVWNAVRRERGLDGRTLRAVLAFQKRAAELQRADWEAYGGTTPDGAVFLWLRTCRACIGTTRHGCDVCGGTGVLNHTTKRRGQPLDAGFCGWALRKLDNLPDAVRAKFEEVAE